MLRLLIIDDEPIIADGLHELLSTHYSDSLEVLRVYSSQEAIHIFERARVDIILSDIVMPKMNGIELMNEVRSHWSYCRVIFLTGHNEFDYAYEAIAGGVSAFILKTESDDKIIAAVDQCIHEINSESNSEDFLLRLQSELDENRILIQRESVLNFLKGKTPPELFLTRTNLSNFPIDPKNACLLICGRINATHEIVGLTGEQAKIKTLFYQYTRTLGDGYLFFENDDTNLNAILQPRKFKQNFAHLASEALESMQDASISVTGIEVSFVVDDQIVSIEQLPSRYTELTHYVRYWLESEYAPQLLQASFFNQMLDGGRIVDLSSRPARAENINRVQSALENNIEDEFMEAIRQVKIMLAELDENSLLRLEILSSLVARLTSYINRRQLASQLPVATYQALCSLFSKASNEVYESLRVFGGTIFSAAASIKYSSDKVFILKIHQYITDHMAQSITMLQLGEYMHYNPAYMSRKYKQITGNNLTDAIINMKMIHAQELIRRQPHLKIKEVAEKTGFQYAAYFTRVFKKHFDISPQDYRDLAL